MKTNVSYHLLRKGTEITWREIGLRRVDWKSTLPNGYKIVTPNTINNA